CTETRRNTKIHEGHEDPRRARRSTKDAKIHEGREDPRRTRRSTKDAKIHEGREDPRRTRRSTKDAKSHEGREDPRRTRRSTKGGGPRGPRPSFGSGVVLFVGPAHNREGPELNARVAVGHGDRALEHLAAPERQLDL